MDATDRSHRTWLCTVVFLDIVEYSQKTVIQQIALKEYLNHCISHAVKHFNVNDRIILDTGDGAALCFMGDPEEALFVALSLRDALAEQDVHDAQTPVVRIGINLGPARIVRDINGQLNIIGDGINVAQRVMSFAQPNQVLVSRSFYEVMSRLSQEYDQLFRYRGLHKDKHVREHAVYEVVVVPSSDPPPMPADVAETRDHQKRDDTDMAAVVRAQTPNVWDEKVLQAAEVHLARYIGPLAKILVQKAAKQTTEVTELYRILAETIPHEHEQRLFLGTVPLPKAKQTLFASPRPPESQTDTAETRWDPAVLQTMADRLAQYLGPVANLLVRREAKKAKHLTELYHALATHIPVEQEKADFLGDLASH
jgi:class 3 adenylate cyclase